MKRLWGRRPISILVCSIRPDIKKKKASNKSYSELNFVQKTPLAYMSISSKKGARELQTLICLKPYNVQKWEIRFTLGLNAAKNNALYQIKVQIKVVQN